MKYGFSVIFKRNAPVNAPVKLTSLQEKIVAEIQKNNQITYDELSRKLKTHRTTIMRNIAKLKEKSIISREGSNKSGYWIVIDKRD